MPWKSLLWLAVPVVGLLELVAQLFFANRAPELDEWRALVPAVSALHRPGDLIVVAPRWAEPNARHAFGGRLMPLAHVARADVTTFGRAIEVSTLGKSDPELADFRVVEDKREGKFRLRVLENPKPVRVVHDFVEHLPEASVSDLGRGEPEPCRWDPKARRNAGGLHGHPAFPSERHVCPGPDHHFAGVTVIEDEGWRPRRCIWAHPVDSKTLSIAFDDVPLGGSIRGHGAIPWWLEREKRGAPVTLEVLVDDRPIGRFVHKDGDGWKQFQFPTAAAGKHGRVEFRVSSTRTKERQFCFVADTR